MIETFTAIFIWLAIALIFYRLDLIMDALDIPRLTLDKNWKPIIKPKSQRLEL